MNIKCKKNYTLENVSHEDIETIVKALTFYRKSFLYEDFNEKLLKELGDLTAIPVEVSYSADPERDLLKRLRPFDSMMIPDEIFPGCSIKGMCWFLLGKSNQLHISMWDSRVSFDHKEKAKTAFYINKHCAILLKDFLKRIKNSSIQSYTYLDSAGAVSNEKTFLLKYNAKDSTLRINKDSSEIVLSRTEQICLEEFLISHLED